MGSSNTAKLRKLIPSHQAEEFDIEHSEKIKELYPQIAKKDSLVFPNKKTN